MWRWRRRRREPAPVVVWRPPPYVLPVDSEPPEDYVNGPPAEQERRLADAKRSRELERVQGERRDAAIERAATRVREQLREEIARLNLERDRIQARADLDAARAEAQRNLNEAAAAAGRAAQRQELDDTAAAVRAAIGWDDAEAEARTSSAVAAVYRRARLARAEADAATLPPTGESQGEPGETPAQDEGNAQVSGGDPDPWILPPDARKIDEAREFYLRERRRGESPSLARVNRHIRATKQVLRSHTDAWDAELAQERRFRAVGD